MMSTIYPRHRASWRFLPLAAGVLACRSPRSLPATAAADSFAVYRRVPPDSLIPRDALGASIRRGLALLTESGDSLPAHVGNGLRCISCHPANGRQPNAMPWVGVYTRYPQYRSRGARVITIEDRINGCFQRSMNGRALDPGGPDMRDIVSYMAFLSTGFAVGERLPGQGLPALAVSSGDSGRGRQLFQAECIRCHGPDGEGTGIAPPLWGDSSFNIGAGMARIRTAGAFIRFNMPFDKPGTLTDQQAMDLAAYVTSRPRPDFPGKELDWPNGDPPPDVAYETIAARRKADSVNHQVRP